MKFLRRAISPIIATVLLILIAIATGIVIYAFAAGWIGTRFSEASGPQAILVVEASYFDDGTLVLYVRNDGSAEAMIVRAYITDPNGTIISYDENAITGTTTIEPGERGRIEINTANGLEGALDVRLGATYTVKLISRDGAEVTVRVRA